ncbi:hypothetical protein ACTMTJ_34500 [Phytohabitans sp. LJ34]|uniref:hypothetical protein n=1 Tax=Phytohabitans sp. LJ34 TaxID=3452217 RepID=UPI003F894788
MRQSAGGDRVAGPVHRPDDRAGAKGSRATWQVRRGKICQTRLNGQPVRTIADLRAEYGQNVLDDAARDHVLDQVLTVYEQQLVDLMRRPDRRLDLLAVTTFANLYVDSLSEPSRRPAGEPPYGGYSHPMLVIAAMCRLAERLPAITRPGRKPQPTPADPIRSRF